MYTVRASDAAGNAGPPSDPHTVLVDRTPPVAPGRPDGPAITNGTVPLTWTPVDDAGSGIDHYVVYRDGAAVATPSAPAFIDGTVTLDGSYAYEVAAVDGAGNAGGRSAARTVVVDTTAPDTSLPGGARPDGSRLGAGALGLGAGRDLRVPGRRRRLRRVHVTVAADRADGRRPRARGRAPSTPRATPTRPRRGISGRSTHCHPTRRD